MQYILQGWCCPKGSLTLKVITVAGIIMLYIAVIDLFTGYKGISRHPWSARHDRINCEDIKI